MAFLLANEGWFVLGLEPALLVCLVAESKLLTLCRIVGRSHSKQDLAGHLKHGWTFM